MQIKQLREIHTEDIDPKSESMSSGHSDDSNPNEMETSKKRDSFTPTVVIHQLTNRVLQEALRFNLTKEMCFKSSADNDYLILKVKKNLNS